MPETRVCPGRGRVGTVTTGYVSDMPDALTPDQRRRLAAAEASARMLRPSLLNASTPRTSQILDLAEWILYGGLADDVDEEQEALAAVHIEQVPERSGSRRSLPPGRAS